MPVPTSQLDDLHNHLEQTDEDYRNAVQTDPALAREYLKYAQQQFDLNAPVMEQDIPPAPLFSTSQERHVPKPAISGGTRATDTAPASSESTEEPSFSIKKRVNQNQYLTPDEQRRFNELRRLDQNKLSPAERAEESDLITKAMPMPTDAEIKALPTRQDKPDFSGSPFDKVQPPTSKGDDGTAPLFASDGTAPRTTATQPAAQAQPQQLFTQQPVPEEPQRGMGRIDVTGLDRTPVQPEPEPKAAAAPQSLFAEEQKPAMAKPVVSQALDRQPTAAEVQGAASDERVNVINRLNRSLEQLFGAPQIAPQTGGLPQARMGTPRKRGNDVEQLLSQLSPHAADVIRAMPLEDGEIKAMLSRIVDTRQKVHNVQRVVRSTR
jgi:hypothetical protein